MGVICAAAVVMKFLTFCKVQTFSWCLMFFKNPYKEVMCYEIWWPSWPFVSDPLIRKSLIQWNMHFIAIMRGSAILLTCWSMGDFQHIYSQEPCWKKSRWYDPSSVHIVCIHIWCVILTSNEGSLTLICSSYTCSLCCTCGRLPHPHAAVLNCFSHSAVTLIHCK